MLTTTHDSQGSDMGLFGGFLGWDAADEWLVDSAQAIREAGIRLKIQIADYSAVHPNTYKLTLASFRSIAPRNKSTSYETSSSHNDLHYWDFGPGGI